MFAKGWGNYLNISYLSLLVCFHRGSQESLDYGDGVVGEHRFDSIGEEEDTTLFRRRLIKAVEEDGELMSGKIIYCIIFNIFT